ncbi:MAG: RAMP superfamily CRISPR-associated protein [Myxococcota bacterium]
MFRKSYNRAVLRLRLETVSPLLIRAGFAGLDPTLADLVCVRTRHLQHGSTVYIPGSSFKGVLRAAVEASIRGSSFGTRQGACNPFENKKEQELSCSVRVHKRRKQEPPLSTSDVYKMHCSACRTFGSTVLKGRVGVRDFFPWPNQEEPLSAAQLHNLQAANKTELRLNVAIDRIKGSVADGPFDQELVPVGVSFWGELSFENYQLWQLGLVASALEELNLGFVQLGSGKSRGLGFVRVHVESFLHEQSGREGAPATGVGRLATERERLDYGLEPDAELTGEPGLRRGLAVRFEPSPEQLQTWLEHARNTLGGAT